MLARFWDRFSASAYESVGHPIFVETAIVCDVLRSHGGDDPLHERRLRRAIHDLDAASRARLGTSAR